MERSRCVAEVELRLEDPVALARALEPDNRAAPPGVRVECRGSTVLYCIVEAECRSPRGILTLRNTVDDLLQSLQAAVSALKASG